jgi:hypothetical protein
MLHELESVSSLFHPLCLTRPLTCKYKSVSAAAGLFVCESAELRLQYAYVMQLFAKHSSILFGTHLMLTLALSFFGLCSPIVQMKLIVPHVAQCYYTSRAKTRGSVQEPLSERFLVCLTLSP